MNQVERQKLARFMEAIDHIGRNWSETELADIYQHLLDTPLSMVLSPDGTAAKASQPPLTVRMLLLTDLHPDINNLIVFKEFSKNSCSDASHSLPLPVAMTAYYITIVVAYVRCSQWISALTPKQLRTGLEWVARQNWIDQDSRRLVEQAQLPFDTIDKGFSGGGE